jgi:hypothetical protein
MIFRITGGFRKARTSPLKGGGGRGGYRKDLAICKEFYRSMEKTLFWIFVIKRQPKIVKTVSINSKSSALIFRSFKKDSSCDTVPFKWHPRITVPITC